MNTNSLRAKADSLLRKHGGKLDKGLASAERFAKKKTKGNPAKARSVEQAANKVRGALAKQQRGGR